eukprot:2524300-Prymnesium_polylepis.1
MAQQACYCARRSAPAGWSGSSARVRRRAERAKLRERIVWLFCAPRKRDQVCPWRPSLHARPSRAAAGCAIALPPGLPDKAPRRQQTVHRHHRALSRAARAGPLLSAASLRDAHGA